LRKLGQVSRALVQEACDAHLLRLKHCDLRKDLLLAFFSAKRRRSIGSIIFRAAGTDTRSLPL
ncbi:hypothetical protein L9G15_21920, partial [Shewanella sp. A3A]|nr:hypothetical protein [Shewanella ferrihydritica]